MACRARQVISASTQPPPMVPTMRPSGYTTILAPAFWGVDPCVATTVTSAAGWPPFSAARAASRTSLIAGRIPPGPRGADAAPQPGRRQRLLRLWCRVDLATGPLMHPLHDEGAQEVAEDEAADLLPGRIHVQLGEPQRGHDEDHGEDDPQGRPAAGSSVVVHALSSGRVQPGVRAGRPALDVVPVVVLGVDVRERGRGHARRLGKMAAHDVTGPAVAHEGAQFLP